MGHVVIVESPYAGDIDAATESMPSDACADCFSRGEIHDFRQVTCSIQAKCSTSFRSRRIASWGIQGGYKFWPLVP